MAWTVGSEFRSWMRSVEGCSCPVPVGQFVNSDDGVSHSGGWWSIVIHSAIKSQT